MERNLTLGIDLELRDRRDDRVIVCLALAPNDGGCDLDGASVQLLAPDGTEVCPRQLLPIAGRLLGRLSTCLELRTEGKLPAGCQVVATAWGGPEQVQACCPADPFTSLRDHVRQAKLWEADPAEVLLEVPSPKQVDALIASLPWINRACRRSGVAVIDAAPDVQSAVEEAVEELGLDDECARWLHELLEEP